MKIKITYTQAVSLPNYISVALTESGIIDPQLTATDTIENYVHNHALRKMVKPYNGLKLGDSFSPGTAVLIGFETTLDQKWVADSMHVNAFVHRRGEKDLEVLHVQETKLR